MLPRQDLNGAWNMAAANEPDPVAAQPAFTERLLFVNHDAKNMKSRPFREKVFSHIQVIPREVGSGPEWMIT